MPRASTATFCNRRATTVACRGRCRGEMAGTLYVVATPLGNLEDLSPRAAATLTRVAAVAAEDTRHTKPLLAHVGSHAELISFHAHSSDAALRRILHLLASGKDVALVTDAGARELTKLLEETRAGTLAELAGYYAEAPARGEVTVMVAGTGKPAREERAPSPDPQARARALLAQGMTRRDVAEQLAAETGITRNTAYRLGNEL